MPEQWRLTLVVAIVFIGAVVYGALDPARFPFFPRCPVYVFTGLECPGCGSQRAVHCLLHGDFVTAWNYNAGLMIAMGLLAFIGFSSLFKEQLPAAYRIVHSRFFAYGVLFGVAFWCVFRNTCL